MNVNQNIFLNKKILIYGSGKTGISTFKFLNKKNKIYLFDDNKNISSINKIKKIQFDCDSNLCTLLARSSLVCSLDTLIHIIYIYICIYIYIHVYVHVYVYVYENVYVYVLRVTTFSKQWCDGPFVFLLGVTSDPFLPPITLLHVSSYHTFFSNWYSLYSPRILCHNILLACVTC